MVRRTAQRELEASVREELRGGRGTPVFQRNRAGREQGREIAAIGGDHRLRDGLIEEPDDGLGARWSRGIGVEQHFRQFQSAALGKVVALRKGQRDTQFAARQKCRVHGNACTGGIGTCRDGGVAEHRRIKRHREFVRPLVTDRLRVQRQERVARHRRGDVIHIDDTRVIQDDQVGGIAGHCTVGIGDGNRVAGRVCRKYFTQGQRRRGGADDVRAVVQQVGTEPPPLETEWRRAIDIDAELSRRAGDQVGADRLIEDDRRPRTVPIQLHDAHAQIARESIDGDAIGGIGHRVEVDA